MVYYYCKPEEMPVMNILYQEAPDSDGVEMSVICHRTKLSRGRLLKLVSWMTNRGLAFKRWGEPVLAITLDARRAIDSGTLRVVGADDMAAHAAMIGTRLHAARKAKRMSLLTLAHLIGITNNALDDYEKGSQLIPMHKLRLCAQMLNKPLEYFVEEA